MNFFSCTDKYHAIACRVCTAYHYPNSQLYCWWWQWRQHSKCFFVVVPLPTWYILNRKIPLSCRSLCWPKTFQKYRKVSHQTHVVGLHAIYCFSSPYHVVCLLHIKEDNYSVLLLKNFLYAEGNSTQVWEGICLTLGVQMGRLWSKNGYDLSSPHLLRVNHYIYDIIWD